MTKQQRQTPENRMAVIYARYSSHNQRDVSIEQQVNACRKYAAENGLEVLGVYDDHAMTGTNDNRPQFRKMLRDSASGAFAYVIVYTLDRFSRDRYDSAVHKHTLRENGVRVLSAMENIQDNPTGVLMESILEGFAEYYSKELAQKIRRGLNSNAEKCMVIGALPLGYRKGADGRYEIAPEEAQIVREIFERIANGEAFAAIFRDLNARGIRTKHGGAWNKASLNRMLHNERYIGVYQYADIRNEHGIPPIIDRALYETVQRYCQVKPRAQRNPQRRRREKGMYLLTGKLFCGHCKSPMTGVSGTGQHGELHYYYACKARRAGQGACRKKPAVRDAVELLIARELRQLLRHPDVLDWLADQTIAYFAEHQETDEIAMLRQRLSEIRSEEANTLRAIRMGIIAKSVQQMLDDLEAEERTVSASLAVAQSRLRPDLTREHILAWLETFMDGDVEDKTYQAALFDAFLSRAYLYDDKIKICFNLMHQPYQELEIPIDIDNIEDLADQCRPLPPDTDCAEVRIDSASVHQSHKWRTFLTW